MGQQIPFYKYLNSGAIPKQVNRVEDSVDTDDRIQNIPSTERVFGGQDLTATNSLSESSTSQPDTIPLISPNKVLSVPVPVPSTDPASYFGVLRFPEGPPSRSPLPPEWSYSEPSSDINISHTSLLPLSLSPPTNPSLEKVSVIQRNPSVGRSHSAPVSPTPKNLPPPLKPKCFRKRSPFLGISSLEARSWKSSGLSLDWDNYASSPTFYRRENPIPVVVTPSTSLESTPDRLKEAFQASRDTSDQNIGEN